VNVIDYFAGLQESYGYAVSVRTCEAKVSYLTRRLFTCLHTMTGTDTFAKRKVLTCLGAMYRMVKCAKLKLYYFTMPFTYSILFIVRMYGKVRLT